VAGSATMRTWVKKKYVTGKQNSRYKSKHNDGTRRRLKRKVGDAAKLRIRASQPLVTLVLLPTGKRRFVREERGAE